MKVNLKKFLSMLLVLTMIVGMVPAVSAEGDVTEVSTSEVLVNAMKAGGNIKLTGDIALTEKIEIPAGVTATLDLNGKTISSTNEANRIENAGNLTINDSREGGKDGEIKMTPASETATVSALKNTGTLTINGGKFTTTTKTKTAQAIYSESPSVTINGGTFEANHTGTGASAYTLVLKGNTSGSSVATINGGTFISKSNSTSNTRCATIYPNCKNDQKITITINGGTFDSERKNTRTASVIYFKDGECGATVVINGGTFSAKTTETAGTDDKLFAASTGSLIINGGTFTYNTGVFTSTSRPVTITGGTFVKWDGTKNDISTYIKTEGYTQADNGAVAQHVATSEALVAAMAAGGNIRLSDDIALGEKVTVPAGKTVVLDLNGKKITSANGQEYYLNNAGNLTIKDSGETGEISTVAGTTDASVYAVYNDGTLIVDGGKISATSNKRTAYAIISSGPVTINGGTIESHHTVVNDYNSYALTVGGTDTAVTINGGTITATGVSVNGSTRNTRVAPIAIRSNSNVVVTINDGNFTGTREAGPRGGSIVKNDGADNAKVIINGGTFSATKSGEDGMLHNVKGTLEINGGTFKYDGTVFKKNTKLTVTGGTFLKQDGTKNDISAYLTDEYSQLPTGAVINGSVTDVNNFADFQAEIEKGGSIRLTGSFELTSKVTISAGVEVVLDLNGQTITSNDSANVYISNAGNLTLLDSSAEQTGTIVAKEKGSTGSSYGLTNSGELIVAGGRITVESKNRSCYALYSTGKSVVINGGTFESTYASTGGAYVCYLLGLGGTNSTVTINGGKFIATNKTTHVSSRSTVLYGLGDSNVQVTVNGGDFTATREGSDGASFVRWADSSSAAVTIKGGKIAVTEGDTIGMFDNQKGTLSVIGGQFQNTEGEPFDIVKHLGAGYEQLDDGSVVVDDPNMPIVVELNGVKYKSLLRALKKTNAGDVLALLADVTLPDTLVIPEGVHIDLQGNTLEVAGLIAEGSQITDSTQQGLLKVAKDKAIFIAGNQHLPVWDEAAGGYRMAQVKIQTKTTATTGVYYFRYDLVNAAWENLLLENMEDSGTKISVLLHVDGIDTPFEAPADRLQQMYEDATGRGAIKVAFVGMDEKLDVQFGVASREVEITKSTGVEPAPVISANGPEGKVDTLPADVRSYMADATAKYTGLDVLVNANTTSVKNPTTKNLYKNLQPVVFEWTLENAKFIKADAEFSIELSTNADFTNSRIVDCVNYVAGCQQQSEPVWNLMTDTTYYWRVVATLADGTKMVTETKTIKTEAGPRLIYVQGAENTRDQGGWLVSHNVVLSDGTIVYLAGERTTQGRVYRSGRLETLTADGIDTIVNELGIKTQVDLRERKASYDVVSDYGVNFVQRSDGKTCLDYTEFLKYPDRAKEALLVFANADNYPILYNCYYGADRTGSLAVVLGALQGMSAADLIKDYELTTSRYLHRGGSLDIKALLSGLNELEGANLYEKARSFCKSAGLTDEEIDSIVLLLSGRERATLEPNESGVYEIRTARQLFMLPNYASQDNTYKLMNDIDMGGADWTPVANFNGTFDGNGKTISNFTISKSVGNRMGFFAATAKESLSGFRTTVKNLHLDVQIIIDGTDDAVNDNADVRFVGGIVGENFGDVENCSTVCIVTDMRQLGEMKKTYYGTLVGNNAEREVDGEKVPLGVISGTNALEPSMNITEESKKAETKDYTVPYKKSETKVNSKMALFLASGVDYATKTAKTQVGIAGNTNGNGINKSLLWQDLTNSTDLAATALQERRETAAAEMYELCTVEWKPAQDMYNYYNYSTSKGWETETTVLAYDNWGSDRYKGYQRGLPYAHSATSMERFNALIGHYNGALEQWSNKAYYYNTSDAIALDGGIHENQDQTEWGLYIGSDCIAQVSSAWRRICAWNKDTPGAARLLVTGESFPSALYMGWYNFKPVNDLVFEIGDVNQDGKLTNADVVDNDVKYTMITEYAATNKTHYLDSFAMVSKADVLIGYSKSGNGHALMALSDAVVIRNYAGSVDANKSFIITAEQGGTGADSDGINRYSYSTKSGSTTTYYWRSTCCVDRKYSFAALLQESGAAGATGWKYFPITCDVLRNADSAAATATISMDASGKVTSNFHIISTTVNGETVFTNMEQTMSVYRGAKTTVTLTTAHSTINVGDTVTVQLSNGKTYTGVYGTAGLTEAN